MVENNWLGDKTGQGFFKKTKGSGGEKEILTLDLKTLEYGPRVKPKFATWKQPNQLMIYKTRLKMLVCRTG